MGAKGILAVSGAAFALALFALSRLVGDGRARVDLSTARSEAPSEAAAPELREPSAAPAEPVSARVQIAPPPSASAPLRPRRERSIDWIRGDPDPLPPPGPNDAWVSGRVESADGRTLADVEVALDAYCPRGCPDVPVRTRTNPAGAFRVRVPEPRPHDFEGTAPHPDSDGKRVVLSIAVRGHLPLRRALELEWGAAENDLGTLVLPRGGRLRGVAAPGTAPLASGEWSVSVSPRDPRVPDFLPRVGASALPDARGAFELGGLGEGPALVHVVHARLGVVEEREVVIPDGGAASVELDYGGGDPDRILVVAVRRAGRVEASDVVVRDPRGLALEARRLENDRFAYLGVDLVYHELVLARPGREPRVVPDVLPGRQTLVDAADWRARRVERPPEDHAHPPARVEIPAKSRSEHRPGDH